MFVGVSVGTDVDVDAGAGAGAGVGYLFGYFLSYLLSGVLVGANREGVPIFRLGLDDYLVLPNSDLVGTSLPV